MLRALLPLVACVLRSTLALFRSREDQAIVEMALRQQLAVYVHGHPRPRLSPLDRAFWVALARFWPHWRTTLVLVRPETVIRWHRKAFRGLLAMDLETRPGSASDLRGHEVPDQPNGDREWLASSEDPGRTREAGIHLGLTTISRYLPMVDPGRDPQQRWMIFLRNHRDVIAGMDFFVVPTVRFQLLYVWFALDHGRRRVLHFNVTAHPTANWVVQQLRDAFPDAPDHRFLIFDNDAIFSSEVARSIRRLGIHPRRTALQSPWQNGTAERFVGTVRRELLDHVVVLNEDRLKPLLREYAEYYNTERVHTSIDDAPEGRVVETRPSDHARVIGLPRVGGLHHRYVWAEAA